MIHLLNIGLVFGNFAFSAIVWSDLPSGIPVHYNFSGYPDGWIDKTLMNWYMLPVISVFTTMLVYGSARLVRNNKRLNVPKKDQFLKLPAEEQEIVVEYCRYFCYKMAVIVNFIFFYIQVMNYMVAIGIKEKISNTVMFILSAFIVYSIIEFVFKLRKLVIKLVEEQEV